MKSHFFAYISRMRFIRRWALMRNTAPENVQEHSHQTAVLAHALAVIRNRRFGGHIDPGAVAAAALYHDASEILTGDMPTPIKYDNPAIRNAYRDVEAVAAKKLLGMLPMELQEDFAPVLTAVPGAAGDRETGKGGGQAVRPYQVLRGAESRKPGVPAGRRPDPPGFGELPASGGPVLSGYLSGQFLPDPG